jgi:hypothetical protein
VQPDEELRERRPDRRLGGGQHPSPEDEAVRERELEQARDDDRIELLPLGLRTLGDDADRLDRGDAVVGERREKPVLPLRDPLRELLQAVVAAVQRDEADDVAADAALDVDVQLLRPLRERERPGELEERPLVGARDKPEVGPVSGGNDGVP